jgi:dTDP-4-dehydrorhamnose reductase
MRVGIVGATGQLGRELVEIFGSRAIPFGHEELEVRHLPECRKVLGKTDLDWVINCAAYVRVDDAEDFPDEAFGVNAVGARNVALASHEAGASILYISTDHVFDGEKGSPYNEEDLPNPINTYGLSKYAGEISTRNFAPGNAIVVRTSSLYGASGARGKGGNFVETMIQKAEEGQAIRVVEEITMSPTYAKDGAKAIQSIIERNLPKGVYHVANQGFCSWFEFAKTIFELLDLQVDMEPIGEKEWRAKARRPRCSALRCRRLTDWGIRLRPWKEALKSYLQEERIIKRRKG